MPRTLTTRVTGQDGGGRDESAPGPGRLDRWLTLVGALLVAAYVGVTLLPALLGRGVLLDVGLLTRYLPFGSDGTVSGAVWCRGDTVDSVLPALTQIRDGVHHGDLPTWTTYEAGGAPLASQPQNNFLHPTIWPYLLVPVWYAPALTRLAQVAVAVAGMVAFLGRHGVRRGPALVAGVAFASCGFMVMWNNWPQVSVACVIPALFWAVDRAVTQPSPRSVAWLGVVFAGMLLGGFPSITLYALTAAAVYAVARLVVTGRRAGTRVAGLGILTAAGGMALGTLLSAVQLLPFVENLGVLRLDDRQYGTRHLPLSALITSFAPDSFGTCVDGVQYGGKNAVETISFAGAAVLVLAAYAIASRRPGVAAARWVLATVLVVAAVGIWAGGPLLTLLQHLPFYRNNFIWRATAVTGFLLAALAGFGLDALLRPRAVPDEARAAPRRYVGWLLPVGVLVVVAAVGWRVWRAARAAAAGAGTLDVLHDAVRWPLVALVLAVALLAAAVAVRGRLRLLAVAGLAVLVVAQCSVFAHRLLPLSSRDDFYPATDTHRFLEAHLGEQRYASAGGVMYAATSDFYGLRTPVGHQFIQSGWIDLLKTVDPAVMVTPTFANFSAGLADVGRDPVLDQLAVRYWVTDPGYLPGDSAPAVVPTSPDGTVALAPGARAGCAVPSGLLAGLEVRLADTYPLDPSRPARLHVRVTRGDGSTVSGSRTLLRPHMLGRLRVALPPGTQTAGPGRAEVWFTGRTGTVRLLAAEDGSLACHAVRPDPDLPLVQATTGANVFQRPGALPRIRWAGTSRVVADPQAQVQLLAAGLAPGTVLLDHGGTPPGSGGTADLDVVTDGAERIAVDVQADGAGYLVVADSVARAGWSATVDGRPAPLLTGDHAFATVPVPAGAHRVELHYTAPGMRTGAVVSASALGTTVLLFALPALRRRRRTAPAAD